MKGQFTIEFVVSAMLFVAIIVYIMTTVSGSIPLFKSQHRTNELKSIAYHISEVMVFSKGSWDADPIRPISIGLGADYYVMNSTRIQYFNMSCSNSYSNILKALNFDVEEEREFQKYESWALFKKKCVGISMRNSTGFIACYPPKDSDCDVRLSQNTTIGEITRYATDDRENFFNITVDVW